MGEIADSMIDGEFDFFTGEYLGPGVGYPRTGNRSLPWERAARGNSFYFSKFNTRKDSKALFGIKSWIYNNHYPNLDIRLGKTMFDPIIAAYGKSPEEISNDFAAFKSWCKTYFKPKK
jgi:hypothetical protein